MDTSPIRTESQIDGEDAVYTCKACDKILEEGKAYELAGNRWHIDCFRCHNCSTFLDSDANLLLLGDGSLICNNCTYSCAVCNQKIEELAILTGDQSFCKQCFRCRNCKKTIPELKYARTSAGIFCMACYENVQRRKRHRTKNRGAGVDKALPEPPKHDSLHPLSSDVEPLASENEKQPIDPSRTSHNRRHDSLSHRDREPSIAASTATSTNNVTMAPTPESKELGILTASTYQAANTNGAANEHGLSASIYDPVNDLAGFFVPLVLDPIPAQHTPSQPVDPQDYSDLKPHPLVVAQSHSQHLNSQSHPHSHPQSLPQSPLQSNMQQLPPDQPLHLPPDYSNHTSQSLSHSPSQNTPQNHSQSPPHHHSLLHLNPQPQPQDSSKDYLTARRPLNTKPSREVMNDARRLAAASRSSSIERKPISTPHIAFQEKRQDAHIAAPAPPPALDPARSSSPSTHDPNAAFRNATRDKRSTMASLDAQREIVLREVEVLTNHLRSAKDSTEPFESATLEANVLSDFRSSLDLLKTQFSDDIESLALQRNELRQEIDSLIAIKHKGFTEYEVLSNRNIQLHQQNTEMQQAMDGMAKSSSHRPNGLGVTMPGHQQQQHATTQLHQPSTLDKQLLDANGDSRLIMESSSSFAGDSEQDSAAIITPHVINLKAQKAKGLMGLFSGLKNVKGPFNDRDARDQKTTPTFPTEGMSYASMSVDSGSTNGTSKAFSERGKLKFPSRDPNGKKGHQQLIKMHQNNSSSPSLTGPAKPASELFGSDLTARCAFEGKDHPAIVVRCIQEVESRGFNVEGIYRVSPTTNLVEEVKAGFEKSEDFDISKPDLDIHAVTSCLKSYLRTLPIPLIPFDVHDLVLNAPKADTLAERVAILRKALSRMPKAHQDVLELLVFHLIQVSLQEKKNKMSAYNLAVVFAPTIVQPEPEDTKPAILAVQQILELSQEIFDVPVTPHFSPHHTFS